MPWGPQDAQGCLGQNEEELGSAAWCGGSGGAENRQKKPFLCSAAAPPPVAWGQSAWWDDRGKGAGPTAELRVGHSPLPAHRPPQSHANPRPGLLPRWPFLKGSPHQGGKPTGPVPPPNPCPLTLPPAPSTQLLRDRAHRAQETAWEMPGRWGRTEKRPRMRQA